MSMPKPTIAVIFGSRSAEHDVSIVTAIAAVIKPLVLLKKYTILPIYIAKDGAWYADPKLDDINLYTSGKIDAFLSKQKPIALQLDGGLTVSWKGLKNRSQKIDVVFPATHGTYGEDGALMGLLDMANVPYVGCDMASSVIAMDKVLAKQIVAASRIVTPQMQFITSAQFNANPKDFLDAVVENLKFPLFVKPAHLGSSIGISRVTNVQELTNAIELAAHYDNKILVEEAVQNLIEVTVPILGNDELVPGNTEEPIQGEAFFDFETKYMQQGKGTGGKTGANKQGAQGYSHIPARLDETLNNACTETAQRVYKAVGCSGIARIDLLIDNKAKQIYFNEINPLPGSLYSHNWRSAGITGVTLVERLVELAIERHQRRQTFTTSFTTNFLKQF